MELILTCPISHCLFNDPVIASDGHTYERQSITHWLHKESTSPYTRETINAILIPNHCVKSAVEQYIKDHPDSINNLYRPPEIPDPPTLKKLISANDSRNIIQYLNKFIDTINQNQELYHGYKFIHLYWQYGSKSDCIKLLHYGFNLNIKNSAGETILHMEARYFRSKFLITQLIKTGMDLNSTNNLNQTAHQIARQCNNQIAAQLLTNDSIVASPLSEPVCMLKVIPFAIVGGILMYMLLKQEHAHRRY